MQAREVQDAKELRGNHKPAKICEPRCFAKKNVFELEEICHCNVPREMELLTGASKIQFSQQINYLCRAEVCKTVV